MATIAGRVKTRLIRTAGRGTDITIAHEIESGCPIVNFRQIARGRGIGIGTATDLATDLANADGDLRRSMTTGEQFIGIRATSMTDIDTTRHMTSTTDTTDTTHIMSMTQEMRHREGTTETTISTGDEQLCPHERQQIRRKCAHAL